MEENTLPQALYMDLTLDFTFKKIFKAEENRDILENMVNAMIFPNGKDALTIDRLSDPETNPVTKDSRFAIVDLYCTTSQGERVFVEIQRTKHPNFANRIQINEAHMTLAQVPKGKVKGGKSYDFRLKRMYFLSICNFALDQEIGNPNCRHSIVKMNEETGTKFSDLVKEVYIELPKFLKKRHELETMFHKWVFLFKHLPEEQAPPETEEDALLRRVREQAYLATKTKEEMTAYERERMADWVYQGSIDYAKQEGIEKGKIETAMRLKEMGFAPEKIAQATDLSLDQIAKL